jgi:hypothetical protein
MLRQLIFRRNLSSSSSSPKNKFGNLFGQNVNNSPNNARSFAFLFQEQAQLNNSISSKKMNSNNEVNNLNLRRDIASVEVGLKQISHLMTKLHNNNKPSSSSITSAEDEEQQNLMKRKNYKQSYDFLFSEVISPLGTEDMIDHQNKNLSADYLFKPTTNNDFDGPSANGETASSKQTPSAIRTRRLSRKTAIRLPVLDEREEEIVESAVQKINQVLSGNISNAANWMEDENENGEISISAEETIHAMNRNARAPKKANRGRRPCSHVARRSKRMKRHKGW